MHPGAIAALRDPAAFRALVDRLWRQARRAIPGYPGGNATD